MIRILCAIVICGLLLTACENREGSAPDAAAFTTADATATAASNVIAQALSMTTAPTLSFEQDDSAETPSPPVAPTANTANELARDTAAAAATEAAARIEAAVAATMAAERSIRATEAAATVESAQIATSVAAARATQLSPTFTAAATPSPDLGATATAEAARIATAVAAALAAQPSPTATPAATATPAPDLAATATAAARIMATSVASTLTAVAPTQARPSASNFAVCLEPCAWDRSNARRTFDAGVEKLYITFDYANFPTGAHYQRIWRLLGQGEWVRYDCAWPGPESGITDVTLTEPAGLHDGTWEVSIVVDGVTVLQETIFLAGNWDAWYPSGTFDTCFGKRSSN